MSVLKKISSVKNVPNYSKYIVTLKCGHSYAFDHKLTKLFNLPIKLPCKNCFNLSK